MAPTYVKLGNVAPKEASYDVYDPADYSPDRLRAIAEDKGVSTEGTHEEIAARLSATPVFNTLDGLRVTEIRFPEGTKLSEAFRTVTDQRGVWAYHSDDVPEFVESDSEQLAQMLAEEYGCVVGIPDDLEARYHTENGPPGVGPQEADVSSDEQEIAPDDVQPFPRDGGFIAPLLLLGVFAAWLSNLFRSELRTDAGKDFQSAVMGTTGAQPAPANYIGLTEDATAPAAGDTTLTGELAGNGLGRAQATYAHTTGASTYTLTKTFTSSDGTARTIRKAGVFNAAANGTMVFETAVTNPPVLQSGDQLTLTETVTI